MSKSLYLAVMLSVIGLVLAVSVPSLFRKKCPKCGAKNPLEQKSCKRCGADFPENE